MIEEVTMYTVVCDNCGKDSNENADYSCYNDKHRAEETAVENEWYKEIGKGEENKHYCPDCFHFDDDDQLIIKPNIKL